MSENPNQGPVPPSADAFRPGEAKGLPPFVVVGVGVVVIAIIGILLFSGPSGSSEALQVAARAPKSCVAVAALGSPQELFEEALEALQGMAEDNKDLEKALDEVQKQIEDELEIDIFDPSAIEKAGFDLSEPITLAVLELGKRGEPKGVVLSFGVSDEEAALDTIKSLAKKAGQEADEDDKDEPTVLILDKDEAVAAVSDDRLYLALGGTGIDADLLREFLEDAEEKPLCDTKDFRAAVAELASGGQFSGYVNLGDIIKAAPKEARSLLDDFEAIAFALDEDEASIFVQVSSKAKAKKLLEPGGSVRKFLSRMDRPLAAMSVSLDNPMEIVRFFFEAIDEEDDLRRAEKRFEDKADLDFDDLEELLSEGAAGVAVYENKGESPPISVLAFVKVNDSEEVVDALDELFEDEDEFRKKKYDDNVLYLGEEVIFGVIDDHFVVGNAMDELKDLADGEGEGWSPTCGGSEVVAGEIFLGDLVKAVAKGEGLSAIARLGFESDGPIKKLMEDMEEAGRVTFSLEQKDEGFLYTSKVEGATGSLGSSTGLLMAMTMPALIRARGEAKKVVCKNNLRQIAIASIQYVDQHGDQRYYPKSLAALVEKKVITEPRVFVCPQDSSPRKLEGLECSYESAFEKYPDFRFTDIIPGDMPFAWDRNTSNHHGGRNVSFFDGHIEFIPDEDEFRSLMKRLDDYIKRR